MSIPQQNQISRTCKKKKITIGYLMYTLGKQYHPPLLKVINNTSVNDKNVNIYTK